MLIIFLIGLVIAALIGAWAKSLGRSAIGWFFISIVLTPVVAVILLLIVADVRPKC